MQFIDHYSLIYYTAISWANRQFVLYRLSKLLCTIQLPSCVCNMLSFYPFSSVLIFFRAYRLYTIVGKKCRSEQNRSFFERTFLLLRFFSLLDWAGSSTLSEKIRYCGIITLGHFRRTKFRTLFFCFFTCSQNSVSNSVSSGTSFTWISLGMFLWKACWKCGISALL